MKNTFLYSSLVVSIVYYTVGCTVERMPTFTWDPNNEGEIDYTGSVDSGDPTIDDSVVGEGATITVNDDVEEEKKRLAAELEAKKEEFTAKAKEIMGQMDGKANNQIRSKMQEEGIPQPIIDELVPAEQKDAAPAQ